MSDYIERNDLIKDLRALLCTGCDADACEACIAEDTIMMLVRYPAANVAPVVHGRWEADPCGWHCSACGADGRADWHRCSHCGVRLDGGSKP